MANQSVLDIIDEELRKTHVHMQATEIAGTIWRALRRADLLNEPLVEEREPAGMLAMFIFHNEIVACEADFSVGNTDSVGSTDRETVQRIRAKARLAQAVMRNYVYPQAQVAFDQTDCDELLRRLIAKGGRVRYRAIEQTAFDRS